LSGYTKPMCLQCKSYSNEYCNHHKKAVKAWDSWCDYQKRRDYDAWASRQKGKVFQAWLAKNKKKGG